MTEQLIQKNCNTGKYKNIYPVTTLSSVIDPETGKTLDTKLEDINHISLPLKGRSRIMTRLQVPDNLRKKGLWITYTTCKGKVITEWYNSNDFSTKAWGNDKNWTYYLDKSVLTPIVEEINEETQYFRLLIGAPNGIAPLNENALISAKYLPSYVDDIVEYPNLAAFPKVGEKSKIYVALDTNIIYRWSGNTYVVIPDLTALLEHVDDIETFLGMDINDWRVSNTTYFNNTTSLIDFIKTTDRNLANKSDDIHNLSKAISKLYRWSEDSNSFTTLAVIGGYPFTKTIYLNNITPDYISVIKKLDSVINENYNKALSDHNISMGNISDLSKAMQAADDALNKRLIILETNAKLNLTITPSIIYKNTNTDIRAAATFTSSSDSLIPTQITITGNSGSTMTQNSKTHGLSESVNINTNTFTYRAQAIVNGVTLNISTNLNARYPIYAGFGTTASTVAVTANRLTARINANGTYKYTSASAGSFFILVPNDITAPTSFTMGGAPYVMNRTTEIINGISYNVFKSGASYASGTTVTIVASTS